MPPSAARPLSSVLSASTCEPHGRFGSPKNHRVQCVHCSLAFADGHKQTLDRPMGVTRTFASPLRLRLPSLPFTLPIK